MSIFDCPFFSSIQSFHGNFFPLMLYYGLVLASELQSKLRFDLFSPNVLSLLLWLTYFQPVKGSDREVKRYYLKEEGKCVLKWWCVDVCRLRLNEIAELSLFNYHSLWLNYCFIQISYEYVKEPEDTSMNANESFTNPLPFTGHIVCRTCIISLHSYPSRTSQPTENGIKSENIGE